jgi:hypothetical protein
LILKREEGGRAGLPGHSLHAIAVVDSGHRRNHEAQGQQPLKEAGALAAVLRRQALGQIKRHHDADEPGAGALQKTPEEQRLIAVGERDDRNAGYERQPAQDHQGLAAHPVGQQAGEQSGEHAAQQHRGHDHRELRGGEAGGCFEIRQRAADDADVDAVEQAA